MPGPLVFGVAEPDFCEGNRRLDVERPRFSRATETHPRPVRSVENHSLKPYRRRVLGTYVAIECMMRTLGAERALAAPGNRERPGRTPAGRSARLDGSERTAERDGRVQGNRGEVIDRRTSQETRASNTRENHTRCRSRRSGSVSSARLCAGLLRTGSRLRNPRSSSGSDCTEFRWRSSRSRARSPST